MSSIAYDNNNTMNLNNGAIAYKTQETKESEEEKIRTTKRKKEEKKKEKNKEKKKKKQENRRIRRRRKTERKKEKARLEEEERYRDQLSDEDRRYPSSSEEEEEKEEKYDDFLSDDARKYPSSSEEDDTIRDINPNDVLYCKVQKVEKSFNEKKKEKEKKRKEKMTKREDSNNVKQMIRKDVAAIFNEHTNLDVTPILVIFKYLEIEDENDYHSKRKMNEGMVQKLTSLDIVHPKSKLVKSFVGFIDDPQLTSFDAGNVKLKGVSLINCPNLTRVYLPPFEKLEYFDVYNCRKLSLNYLGFVKKMYHVNLHVTDGRDYFSFLSNVRKINSLCIEFDDHLDSDDLDLNPLLHMKIKYLLISGRYCRKIHYLLSLMKNIDTVEIHPNSRAHVCCTPMAALVNTKDISSIRCGCIPDYLQRQYYYKKDLLYSCPHYENLSRSLTSPALVAAPAALVVNPTCLCKPCLYGLSSEFYCLKNKKGCVCKNDVYLLIGVECDNKTHFCVCDQGPARPRICEHDDDVKCGTDISKGNCENIPIKRVCLFEEKEYRPHNCICRRNFDNPACLRVDNTPFHLTLSSTRRKTEILSALDLLKPAGSEIADPVNIAGLIAGFL